MEKNTQNIKIINWGILGTGEISNEFVVGIENIPNTNLQAIGSRSIFSAKSFAKKHNVPKYFGSYEELVSDKSIDVVYIGTVNQAHKDNILLCLKNNKSVLCEKPITLNSNELEEIITYKKNKNIFLMEAMRTRFLPHILKLEELLKKDTIGKVRLLQLNFGFEKGKNLDRLFKLEYGGGALLDMGIYGISLAVKLFGYPVDIKFIANIGETGVDEDITIIFKHNNDVISQISCSIAVNMPLIGLITGTKGTINMSPKWWRESHLNVSTRNSKKYRIDMNSELTFSNYLVNEVNRCILNKLEESENMRIDDSFAIMKIIDSINSNWIK